MSGHRLLDVVSVAFVLGMSGWLAYSALTAFSPDWGTVILAGLIGFIGAQTLARYDTDRALALARRAIDLLDQVQDAEEERLGDAEAGRENPSP